MEKQSKFSFARLVAAVSLVVLPLAVFAAPRDRGPKDGPEAPKDKVEAPRPEVRPCDYLQCPYCGEYYGSNCRRPEVPRGCRYYDDYFYGPRHHRHHRGMDGMPPHVRRDRHPDVPRPAYDDAGEYPGGFGWYYGSLSDAEKKEFLSKRKAYYDELDAERKAAYEEKKKAREEFKKKWADFDKLDIEEQEELLRIKSAHPRF